MVKITRPTQIILFCLFIIFCVSSFNPTTSAQAGGEERFDYVQGGERGPDRWGDHEGWHLCRDGTMQSPIDLLNRRVQVVSPSHKLKRNYTPSIATLENNGHAMELQWDLNKGGYIELDGTQYMLQQCHWHSPSEHTIDGKRFDMELHVVHQSQAEEILVIGIMFQIGEPDPFLTSLEEHLDEISETNEKTVVGIVDPERLRTISRRYYRYMGSLTTPPCYQNVTWIVVKEARTVSKEQLSLLHVAVHEDSNSNARPLQRAQGRSVNLFSEGEDVDEQNEEKEEDD